MTVPALTRMPLAIAVSVPRHAPLALELPATRLPGLATLFPIATDQPLAAQVSALIHLTLASPHPAATS